ncbi:hypothetical protein Pelo_15438 [Pelomyxa schiedti]|nr:hypothetical protein Pelo_15438 [Pelomyxa schiedti]
MGGYGDIMKPACSAVLRPSDSLSSRATLSGQASLSAIPNYSVRTEITLSRGLSHISTSTTSPGCNKPLALTFRTLP